MPLLLPIFLSYISGITWYYTHITATIPVIILAIFCIYTEKIATKNILAISCLSFLIGAGQCAYHLNTYNKNYESTVGGAYDITATVTGVENQPKGSWPLIIKAKTHTLHNRNTQEKIKKTITLKIFSKNNRDILPGDTIALKNSHFYEQTKQSLKNYNLKNNICHALFTDKNGIILLRRPKINIWQFLHILRTKLYNAIKKKLKQKPHQLFSLLFLGKREATDFYNTVRNHFSAWGISHYLARSGIHITLFIFALLLFLKFLPLPFWLKQTIALLLLSAYGLLSYQTNSSLRAYTMTFVYITSLLSPSYIHPKDIVINSLLLTLLYNPLQLFALDVQLSYGLTALLCLTLEPKITQTKPLREKAP